MDLGSIAHLVYIYIDGLVMTCVALRTLEVHLALIGLRREDSSEILMNFD